MNADGFIQASAGAARRGLAGALLAWALGGCAGLPQQPGRCETRVSVEDDISASLLAYHQQLQHLPLHDLEWERLLLAAEPLFPEARVRLAMALGQPRGGSSNPGRALALLDGVLKSYKTEAARLHPIARLLASHYQEYLKGLAMIDRLGQEASRLGQQVRSGQLRVELLQQKLDALASIEHSLPIPQMAPEGRK